MKSFNVFIFRKCIAQADRFDPEKTGIFHEEGIADRPLVIGIPDHSSILGDITRHSPIIETVKICSRSCETSPGVGIGGAGKFIRHISIPYIPAKNKGSQYLQGPTFIGEIINETTIYFGIRVAEADHIIIIDVIISIEVTLGIIAGNISCTSAKI